MYNHMYSTPADYCILKVWLCSPIWKWRQLKSMTKDVWRMPLLTADKGNVHVHSHNRNDPKSPALSSRACVWNLKRQDPICTVAVEISHSQMHCLQVPVITSERARSFYIVTAKTAQRHQQLFVVSFVCRAQLDSFHSRQPTVCHLHGDSPGHPASVALPQYRQTGQGKPAALFTVRANWAR